MKRFARTLAAALAITFLALSPFAGRAADPYTIYVILPLTGNAAFLGREEASAIAVIQSTVNKAGGIDGRPIAFNIQDDGSSAQTTVLLFDQVVAKGVPVVLGSSLVSNCAALLPLITQGPLVYCFSPGIHPPAGSYMFSSSISTGDYFIATIRYLREKGLHKLALLTSTDATGQDATSGIQLALNAPENRNGVTLVDHEQFNVSDISVTAQMTKIKASGANAVILWATGPPFGTMLRDAVQTGIGMPVFTSAGNLNYVQLDGYRSFMPDDVYLVTPPWTAPEEFTNPAFRKTVADYLSAFKAVGVRPDQGMSLAWDSVSLVLDALRAKGLNAKPADLREYITGQKGWIGVNGAYDFQAIPQRGVGLDWLVMTRWDKNKQAAVGVSKAGGALK